MTHTIRDRSAGEFGLTRMKSPLESVREAARLIRESASFQGPFVEEYQIGAAGGLIGLSPRQSLRIARGERKSIPDHLMARLRDLRALYSETCAALDESADRKIEALNASSEKRRRQLHPVDGGCDGRDSEPADEDGRRDGEDRPEAND